MSVSRSDHPTAFTQAFPEENVQTCANSEVESLSLPRPGQWLVCPHDKREVETESYAQKFNWFHTSSSLVIQLEAANVERILVVGCVHTLSRLEHHASE